MDGNYQGLSWAEKKLSLAKKYSIKSTFIADSPLKIVRRANAVEITYGRPVELYRALSLVKAKESQGDFTWEETPRFQSDGVMLDCSRNGVMTLDEVKRFLETMALMGLDRLLLYCEDTYSIEGYPYFGYQRGRYSKEELKEIDAFAASLGIEVVPCIQTLAHLANILWYASFSAIRDSDNNLLTDEEKTYQFIEAEIKSCRECFRSSSIHIGMDEAFMMGFGEHFYRHGYEDPTSIFLRHLDKVSGICRRYSFTPMIWSDTLFRMVHGGNYYDKNPLKAELLERVPGGIGLVYWDYYHEKEEDYDYFIKEHQRFSNPLIFAGGSWRWIGFTPLIGSSLAMSRSALNACLKNGVKDVLLTGWGDDGNECSFMTMLPAMALYAEYNYEGNDAHFASLLETVTGETLERMLLLDLPNRPDGQGQHGFGNPSKYLFYQDPIGGVFDKHTNPVYDANYAAYAQKLAQAAKESPHYAYVYQSLAELSLVLAKKANVGIRLREAYQKGDKATLKEITEVDLPFIRKHLSRFQKAMEQQWNHECKPEGFDVLDGRIGWLNERILTAEKRLQAYLADPQKSIPELAETPLYIDGRQEKGETEIMSWNWWGRNVSVNPIG